MNRCSNLIAAALVASLPALAGAEIIADLAGDYVNGTTDGQTTTDVGLPGTAGGAWNYYEDTDGVIDDGSPVLLSYNSVSTGAPGAPSGNPGYEGSIPLFNTLPMPIITSGVVFTETPFIDVPPPAGFLQVHPGFGDVYNLAISYTADSDLSNLVLDYELGIAAAIGAPAVEGFIDYSIIQVVGGVATTLASSPVTVASPTGALSIPVPDMTAGDSIWMLVDPGSSFNPGEGGDPFGDASNLKMTLRSIPEPGTCSLLGLAVAGLLGRRRRLV